MRFWLFCWFVCFFFSGRFKHYNHVVLPWDFGWLQRRVEVSFCSNPFLLRREGHSGCAWEQRWREHWEAFRGARGKGTVRLVKGTRHSCREMCCLPNSLWYSSKYLCLGKWTWRPHALHFPPRVTCLCHPPFEFLQGLRMSLNSTHMNTHTDTHMHPRLPHVKCIVPLYAVQAHCIVCAFQSRQSHHKFPWYHDSAFLISFKLQNHFLLWKKTGKEIVLEVDWSGSAC